MIAPDPAPRPQDNAIPVPHRWSMVNTLYSALLILFFGDYCGLIGLMEYAKKFGSSNKVVGIFVAYALPSLLMLLVAGPWAERQSKPHRQMGIFAFLGAVVFASVLWAPNYIYIAFATFMLGLVKEALLLLLNVYIKFNFAADRRKQVLNNAVSIRFFIMIFGGALGSYFASIAHFNWVAWIYFGTYTTAATLFLLLKPPLLTDTTPLKQPRPAYAKAGDMIQRLQVPLLLCYGLASVGVGAFMSIEYPLLTNELGVLPQWIGVVWSGHIIGTVIAQRLLATSWKHVTGTNMVILFAILQTASFGIVGMFGKGLPILITQMGLAAFTMIVLEVFTGHYVMETVPKEAYPLYNLYMRAFFLGSRGIGSFLPLFLAVTMSLKSSNILLQATLILACLVTWRFCAPRSQTA